MRARFAAITIVAILVSACASNPKRQGAGVRPDTRPAPRIGTREEGMASWYGPGYNGKRTRCGNRFDQDAMTAAHGTWPCGTKAKVTLLSTGKSVVLTIDDLFPNHKGRLIDVSRGVARKIGLIGPGTGRVRVEAVR